MEDQFDRKVKGPNEGATTVIMKSYWQLLETGNWFSNIIKGEILSQIGILPYLETKSYLDFLSIIPLYHFRASMLYKIITNHQTTTSYPQAVAESSLPGGAEASAKGYLDNTGKSKQDITVCHAHRQCNHDILPCHQSICHSMSIWYQICFQYSEKSLF